ncbi:MAG: HIRAN domain-containing protein, partial [Christensenellales bacterium]
TWLFEHGMDCAVARHPRSIELMRKPDMLPKYTSAPDADLQRLSRLLAYAAITQAYRDQPNSLSIVEHYMRRLHAYPMDFITIAAVSMIRARITLPLAPEPDADGSPWPLEDELEIKAACDAYLQTAKQNPVKLRACVRAELRVPKEDSALMMETLEALELYCAFEPPMFDDFLPLLEADAFDLSVMYYTLVRHPKRYAGTAYNRIRFPAEVFGTLEDGDIDDISDEYKPDAWLACLLLALRKAGHHVESYYLHCLSARFPDARIEALHGLRAIRTRWTGAVQPALARALAVEPAERIKRRIRRLMDAAFGAHEKERRYIEIARVKPRTVDETLLFTTIAGAHYRDLSVVADQVAFGDVLLLQREPDNAHDKNAILVAAEDGFVLGYIPRTESAALASRMDAGEALYAILHDDLEYGGRPSIEIKRSHPIEQKGNIVTFPGGYGDW